MEDTQRVRRRGLLAGAAALVAGIAVLKQPQEAAAETIDSNFRANGNGANGYSAEGTGYAGFVTFDAFANYMVGADVTGSTMGVHGASAGDGVHGESTGSGSGVNGSSVSGFGVFGYSTGSSGSGISAGVYGLNSVNSGNAIGVQGDINGQYGIGVIGGHKGAAAAFNGTGVYGLSDGGYGVLGSANNIGVRGNGNTGVQGVTTGGYGVYGSATGSGWGVYGESASGYAVLGQLTANASGKAGVLGAANGANTYGVIGNGLGGAAGVLGKSSGNGWGVQGTNTTGIGVYGISGGGSFPYGVVGSTTAAGIALYGVAGVAGAVGFAAGAGVSGAIAGQFSGNVNFYGAGAAGNTVTLNGANLVVANGGTKNAAVKVADGSFRLLHCVEAPEPWFEDFGEGTLTAGKAEVKLEPLFASTIDTSTLHAFFVSHDANHALHLAGKSATGFTVEAQPSAVALAVGKKQADLSGTFTWRVVGKRKDVSGERLAKFDLPKEITFAQPPTPTTPPDAPKPPTPPVPPVPPVALPPNPPTPPVPPVKKGS